MRLWGAETRQGRRAHTCLGYQLLFRLTLHLSAALYVLQCRRSPRSSSQFTANVRQNADFKFVFNIAFDTGLVLPQGAELLEFCSGCCRKHTPCFIRTLLPLSQGFCRPYFHRHLLWRGIDLLSLGSYTASVLLLLGVRLRCFC